MPAEGKIEVRIRDSAGFRHWAGAVSRLSAALTTYEAELPEPVVVAHRDFLAVIEEGWVEDEPAPEPSARAPEPGD